MMVAGRIHNSGGCAGVRWAPAVFLIVLLLSAPSALAGLPTNGMVLFYSFDTDTGTTLPDESGGGNLGLISSNAAWSASGISHGSFLFNGTNAYITAGPMFNWTNFSGGFSLVFWTRQNEPEIRGSYFAGTTGGAGALTNRFELGCNEVSQGDLVFRLYDDEGRLHLRRYSGTGVDDGEWHHVAMLIGTNAGEIHLLLDSVEIAPGETSGTVFQLTGLNFPLVVGTTDNRDGAPSSTNSLNGSLDDFRIFGRLLTTGQVAVLYQMMEEEPDDTLWQARLIAPGQTKNHTMKALDDEDWAFFYAVTNFTNYVFSTKNNGTNVDTQLTVYRALGDDTLGLVTSVNNTAMGLGVGESWSLVNYSNDLYYVKITTPAGLYGGGGGGMGPARRRMLSGEDAGFGEESSYSSELTATPAGAVNSICVGAHVFPGRPAASWARVDDGGTQWFVDEYALTFPGLSSGSHDVRVGWRPGIRPREHPTRPGQIQNSGNAEYGNPRTITLSGSPAFALVAFLSEPINYQKAIVRDAHTGAHLDNVSVTCISDSEPFTGTETRRGHAAETSYQQLWRTLFDGSFPTNLMLYPTSWDIRLARTDYTTRTFAHAVSALAWGRTNDLGDLLLYPVDADLDGLADSWETRHFPPESFPVEPWEDEDEDGLDNRSEYLAGTDPTAAVERLQVNLSWVNEMPRLQWIGRPWRRYRVEIEATPPTNNTWAAEPDTVTHWGTSSWEEIWSDANWAGHAQRVYRLEVIRPGE